MEKEDSERLLREIEALRLRVTSLEKRRDPDAPDSGGEIQSDTRQSAPADVTPLKGEQASRALLNATSDSAVLIDKNGLVLDANNNMAASLDSTRDELIGTVIYDHLPPEIAGRRKEREQEAARKKNLVRFVDYRDDRWLENSIYPVFDSNRNLSQFAIFSRDITNYIQAEHALKQERDRAKSYLNLEYAVNEFSAVIGNGCLLLAVYPAAKAAWLKPAAAFRHP